MVAVKTKFLVVYDYGTGGAWALLLADSAEQVRERFPELQIVTQWPAWLTGDQERHLRERMTIDIDDTDNVFLAALVRGRGQDQ
jgi:hypothetical protein